MFRSANGLRVVEIADACGVDRRTIYRDLTLLSEIGLPIYHKDGRFYLNQEYYLATVRLNLNEMVALTLAVRHISLAVEQQNPHTISALSKIREALPESMAAHVQHIANAVQDSAVDRSYVSVLETLTRAWAEKRKIRVWYPVRDDGAAVPHEFAIYFMEMTNWGGVYAIGFDYLAQRVRAFKVKHVKRVQLLQATYDLPARLDRQRYGATICGVMRDESDEPVEVVLAFSADVTPQIRERAKLAAHPVTALDDSRCMVRIQVRDWRDVLPWVRSWGPKVEVLKPQVLRDELVREASHLLATYGARS